MIIAPLLSILASFDHLPPSWDIDAVEYFAGVQSVTRGFAGRGYRAMAYDIVIDSRFDMTTSVGFLYAVELALRVRPRGFAFFAPPCSSFVWVNRGTSGRFTETDTCQTCVVLYAAVAPHPSPFCGEGGQGTQNILCFVRGGFSAIAGLFSFLKETPTRRQCGRRI